MPMPRILIVDDELSMRDFLKILFENEGYEVFVASNAATALDVAVKNPFDVVITDIRMPGMNGLELLVELKQHFPDLPVIMITAYASPDDAVQAMRQGAFDYITKPFHVDELKNVVRTAVQRKASAERKEAGESFAGIVGSSPEMLRIFDLIRRVSPAPASVLIYGESGTGK
ncbi:MAG: sigma-54-dependent Fis family transcriptional regulator, partial [Candidatus Electrothrix sp. AR5]|nr:sigma-54-dependent Fis family transcriptional regulator [Candidatus Electrothrix sp. AR5]